MPFILTTVRMEGNPTALHSMPSSGGAGGWSRQQKILLVSAAVGITAVGLVARYFRRPQKRGRQGSNPSSSSTVVLGKGVDVPDGRIAGSGRGGKSNLVLSPRPSHVAERSRGGGRSSSISSILTQSTLVSNSVLEPITGLNCTQLGILGMETLDKSISFWEESLALLQEERDSELADDEDKNHCDRTMRQLEEILEAAKHLQDLAKDLYLDEGSVLYEGESEEFRSHTRGRLRSSSSVESFLSAEDFLSDDEDILASLESAGFLSPPQTIGRLGEGAGDAPSYYPLYQAALRLVEAGAVPYRSLKTEMVGVSGDQEYLAKLHCLRGAFSRIISDAEKRTWLASKGREVFAQIMSKADKDPTDFEESYDIILAWSQDSGNWGLIENELKDRGLRALTFYDIVLDYIFLDAFEDLESPPASVLAVTQNRWLSNSFKETALGTAIWSVLKTKRKWLRYSDGFMAHFYTLSEAIMPTLAWGFLGPPTTIQELCFFFKDKFVEFLNSVFSFQNVRYTNLDELAEDVMIKLELMHSLIVARIAEAPTPD